MPNVVLIIRPDFGIDYSQATFLVFDATINQAFRLSSKITEHPVESGSFISDHAILQPTDFAMTGVISDDHFLKNSATLAAFGGGMLSAGLASILDFDSDALNVATAAGFVLQTSTLTIVKRSDEAFTQLKNAISTSKVCDIFTDTAYLTGFMIESLQVNRDATTGRAQYFDLTFKQIQIARTSVAEVLPVKDTNKAVPPPEKTTTTGVGNVLDSAIIYLTGNGTTSAGAAN